MKVVIAIDSFKGSMSTQTVEAAAGRAVTALWPEAEIVCVPMADGGEGTMEVLSECYGCQPERVRVTGPLGSAGWATYGLEAEQGIAVMEMAQAAGLPLVPDDLRNPEKTTTYGVGEMLLDAVEKGAKRIVMGIGGSATNDGGTGMLQALGVQLLTAQGRPIPPGAEGLALLETVDISTMDPRLREVELAVICDVTNPLCGPQGCSAAYGPQKGADAAMVQRMDRWMAAYAEKVQQVCPQADPTAPGSGAAGGLGFALQSFLPAILQPGIATVMEAQHLAEHIKAADLVITGEGWLDATSRKGKVLSGVIGLAQEHGTPVVAVVGGTALSEEEWRTFGLRQVFCLQSLAEDREDSMRRGAELTEQLLTARLAQVMEG